MKKSSLKPMSEKRKRLNVERKKILEETFGSREHWDCSFHQWSSDLSWANKATEAACFGPVNAHEILKRSRSGKDSNLLNTENMTLLCNFHNLWVENNPDLAHLMGLAKNSWEAERNTCLMLSHGLS